MSEYKFRIVSGYDGHRLTWHALGCRVGEGAKYSKRTVYTPESRRAALDQAGRSAYYSDHMARCCIAKPTSTQTASPKFSMREVKSILSEAKMAGIDSGNEAQPTPMIVGTPTTPLGNDIDPNKTTYFVAGGVCGFAWVNIRPGNSSFARPAVKLGVAIKSYYGGVEIWIDGHGQSLERKTKHANAFAEVLQQHGINAYANSRID